MGRVVAAIEGGGKAGNTIVIFTSDNGGERFGNTWPFSGRKLELLEGGVRVPAILRWPGRVRPRSVTNQVAITMDWVPTLLAAAGAEPDRAYALDGIDLAPTLNGAVVPRALYWRFRFNQQKALREGDMKFLEDRWQSVPVQRRGRPDGAGELEGPPAGAVSTSRRCSRSLERHHVARGPGIQQWTVCVR